MKRLKRKHERGLRAHLSINLIILLLLYKKKFKFKMQYLNEHIYIVICLPSVSLNTLGKL